MASQEQGDDSESDWEYEYSAETETFYINLDLTTINGPLRVTKKRTADANAASSQGATPKGPDENGGDVQSQQPAQEEQEEEDANANDNGDEDNDDDAEGRDRTAKDADAQEDQELKAEGEAETDTPLEQIQIMELHSANPIISYRNQIFSCEWADLIGTELLFSAPEGYTSNHPRLRQTPQYDLLAANSVKLLGRKASLVSTTNTRQRLVTTAADATKRKTSINQGHFFDRLRAIKRTRGESETIRTSLPTRRYAAMYAAAATVEASAAAGTATAAAAAERSGPSASSIAAATSRQEKLKAWARTDQQLAEVEQLKEKALRGDEKAVAALERIMARTVERAAAEARGEA